MADSFIEGVLKERDFESDPEGYAQTKGRAFYPGTEAWLASVLRKKKRALVYYFFKSYLAEDLVYSWVYSGVQKRHGPLPFI